MPSQSYLSFLWGSCIKNIRPPFYSLEPLLWVLVSCWLLSFQLETIPITFCLWCWEEFYKELELSFFLPFKLLQPRPKWVVTLVWSSFLLKLVRWPMLFLLHWLLLNGECKLLFLLGLQLALLVLLHVFFFTSLRRNKTVRYQLMCKNYLENKIILLIR